MSRPALHPRKLLLFAALSLADLALTWLLIQRGGGQFGEANPVAGWWLARHGWVGLAAFKAVAVLVVAGAALVVSRSRPHFGGYLLGFACAVLTVVVGYSCSLAWGLGTPADEPPVGEIARLAEAHSLLQEEVDRGAAYRAVLEQLAGEVNAGQRSLNEAADRLGACEKGGDPAWLAQLRRLYPGRPDAECLAANVMLHALLRLRSDPAALQTLARRLAEEFETAYGGPPPEFAVLASLPAPPEPAPGRGQTPAQRLEDPVGDSDHRPDPPHYPRPPRGPKREEFVPFKRGAPTRPAPAGPPAAPRR